MRCLMKPKGDDQHIHSLWCAHCEWEGGGVNHFSICKQMPSTKNYRKKENEQKKNNLEIENMREWQKKRNATHQKIRFIQKVFRSRRTYAETLEARTQCLVRHSHEGSSILSSFCSAVARYVPRWFYILHQWESGGRGNGGAHCIPKAYHTVLVRIVAKHAFSLNDERRNTHTHTEATMGTGYSMMRSKAKTTAKVFSSVPHKFSIRNSLQLLSFALKHRTNEST